MPRKPTSRRKVLRSHPSMFSSFARFASSSLVKNRMCDSQFHKKSLLKSTGHGIINRCSEIKKELSESSNELSESSDDEEFEVVQADFAFFDPKPDDFHGVKTLLQTYLDDKLWDLSGFVDIILEQTTVGTVVKLEGDEDNGVYSFITALSLGRYEDKICMKELKEFLRNICQDKEVMNDLTSLLGVQAHTVGLLISQRVVNLPLQLLPPLYDALFDEICWATEDEPTEALRDSFRFKFYIIVSKVYKHKNLDRKKVDEAILYVKQEDEIFHKLCSWSFFFPLATQQSVPREMKNYQLVGLVMAIEANKISTFRDELKLLLS